ncbi:unnamed protein product [Meganyctiphanes norvegica]|uniref:RAP domain-containing protein n=1 Tax=Meganyctiphanes norvegica TaxID=48144 RepID=A0AAV2S2M6_MEGNR
MIQTPNLDPAKHYYFAKSYRTKMVILVDMKIVLETIYFGCLYSYFGDLHSYIVQTFVPWVIGHSSRETLWYFKLCGDNSSLCRRCIGLVRIPDCTGRHHLVKLCPPLPILSLKRRQFNNSAVSKSEDEKTICDTTIMMQDGIYIQELPSIVRVIHGEFHMHSNGKTQAGKRFEGMGVELVEVPCSTFKNIDFEEEQEMILGFMRCNKISEVFNLLNTCPEEEVTPAVALGVMRRIFDLENNLEYRNQGMNQYPEESTVTFTRAAVMKRLVEIVCASSEPQVILDALRAMSRDTFQGDKIKYLEKLCTESLVLITEGKLRVDQVCQAARSFHNLGVYGLKHLEKVWIGLTDREEEMQENELCSVMSIVPLVKQSRKHLYNIVERRFGAIWLKLKTEDVIRILYHLVQLKMTSSRMLSVLSRWTNLNIHNLSEGNLRWIIHSMSSLDHYNINFENALTKFVKAKKLNIKDSSLMAVIMDYCVEMRIRSPVILDTAALYFVKNASTLSVPQISSLFRPFGILNYEPSNSSELFELFELHVHHKFVQFPPNVMIDMMLSCIYLSRYPINFVKKIFNPYFLDRIHSLERSEILLTRSKLKMLDIAMSLEAPTYNGPMLPKDYMKPGFWRDNRLMRAINMIQGPLIEIVGTAERITKSALIPNFPSSEIYIVDCIIDMEGKLSLKSFKWSNKKYAVLIHLPEHYTVNVSGEKVLLGQQVMRKRHLSLLGFKVVSLNSDTLNKFRMHPEDLKSHLQDEIQKAS